MSHSTNSADSAESHRVVVPELQARPSGTKLLERQLDAIRGVKVRLSVVLGETEISVGSLFDLKAGELLSLDRQINEPLDLVIDGKTVARGELVVVGNSLGLRITEIQS